MKDQVASLDAALEALLGQIADEFTERLQRGEQPDIEEYARRHPGMGDLLRQVLATVQVLGPADLEPASLSDQPAAPAFPRGCLGDFRILREIGRGGMGVVYEAEQISLGRRVALKVLPFAATLDPKQLQRFKNEAQAAACLHHQNIVPVYGVGCERAVHFYAMQFIEGQNLAAMIREVRHLDGLGIVDPVAAEASPSALAKKLASGGLLPKTGAVDSPITRPYSAPPPPLENGAMERATSAETANHSVPPISTERSTRSVAFFRTAAQLGIQAAEALEHAHQQGVLHRDIKPANLMVDVRGNLWITDFGLAHCQGQAGLTMTGDLVGTLRYMSPEQALANRVLVDQRTDIYSLGVTLYELLTLQPAFSGHDRQELLRQIAFEEPRPPRRLNPSIPAELETILLKTMAKNPGERYATAQELADDLQRYLKDEPIRAKRPNPWQRVKKWSRRHRSVVWSAAVSAAVVMLVALAALIASNAQIGQERDEKDKALRQVENERQKAVAAERRAQQRLFEAKLAQAKASRWSGRAGRRFEGLEALAEAAKLARDLEQGPEVIRTLRSEAIACMALVDLRLDRKWDGYPSGTTLTGIAFDAEMQHYARVDGDGNITVRRLADNQETVRISDIGAPAAPGRLPDWRLTLLFSPDGRFLASGGIPESTLPLQVWDLNGPKSVLKAAPAGGFERKFDFSPDSRVLAASRPNGSISLYDILTGTQLNTFFAGQPIRCIRFHPRGDRLAVSTGAQVHVLDLAGRPVRGPLVHPHTTPALAWSPDGKLLAVACEDRQVHIWNVDTGVKPAVCRVQDSTAYIAFNQRGDLLATVGADTTQLWDPRSGKELLSTTGLASDFSRDDRWLGLGVFGANVGRWEVAGGGEYRLLHGHPRAGIVGNLDISPDGRLLASAGSDGVRLWDLIAGKEVAMLPTGITNSVIFDRAGRFLITGDPSGELRWPIRHVTEPGLTRLQLGPAEPITTPLAHPKWNASLSEDGRTFAARTTPSTAVILDLDRPNDKPRFISPTTLFRLSPDGKWLAGNVENAYECKLWDAQSGKWVRDFPGIRNAEIVFSPDNRWLGFATSREYLFYRVGSWEPGLRLPRDSAGYHRGPAAFSRDSRIVAIAHSPRVIRLIDFDSGRELATLEAPVPEDLTSLCFTPDGGRLLAGTAHGVIQLWDLRRIRERLDRMGLDWAPPLVAPATQPADDKPLQVEVDFGTLLDREKYSVILAIFPFHAEAYYQRGLAYCRFQQWPLAVQDFTTTIALRPDHAESYWQRGKAQGALGRPHDAIADYTRFLRLLPPDDRRRAEALVRRAGNYERLNNHASALTDLLQFLKSDQKLPAELIPGAATLCNNLAWRLVTGPDKLRDPDQALPLARKAVELTPANPSFWNTLGVAQYRAGDWKTAVATLETAMKSYGSRPEADRAESFNTFFLAMARLQLGDREKALALQQRAIQWMEKHQPKDEELGRFRAEAAALLGN